MESCDVLLSLPLKNLEVWKGDSGGICVAYQGADVKIQEGFLCSMYGIGDTFYEACKDYLKKIRGKTLVFNACSSRREEIRVLG